MAATATITAQGAEFGADFRLLEDFGWDPQDERAEVELTIAPEDLTKALRRLRAGRARRQHLGSTLHCLPSAGVNVGAVRRAEAHDVDDRLACLAERVYQDADRAECRAIIVTHR